MKKFLLGMLLLFFSGALLHSQISNAITYDLRDGTIITAGMTPDGNVSFSGNYSHHGTTYGLNMKVNGEINVKVTGSSTVRFLGSQYSGLTMVGTAVSPGDIGTQNTKVTNDLADFIDFVYSGSATTLNFKLAPGTGNDLYLPTIEIIPAQSGADATMAEKNIVYYFDLRDGSIIPTDTDGKSNLTKGLFTITVGNSNAYGYNGTQHGSIIKGGNKIILPVAGNTKVKFGGSIYSGGTITASSETGAFDITSQNAKTAGNYGTDGSSADFIYVGPAGILTFEFTGTNYIPYIELAPIPYAVTLTSYIQKSGTISVNNVDINIMTGENAAAATTVSVSEGTVISTTNEIASVLINLGGNELSTYTPGFTGQIDTVIVMGDSLLVTFSDPSTDPASYIIDIKDNSLNAEAEPGKTYTYNFYDGSELPQTSYQQLRYTTFVSRDGLLTINSNTDVEKSQFGYHDASHGGVFFPGNSFDVTVAGDAIITFIVDTYGSATDAVLKFKDAHGNVLGEIAGQNIGKEDAFPSSFSYKGSKGKITATLESVNFASSEIYIHGLNVENAFTIEPTNGKTDVWDFGAEQLDETDYNNQLSVDTINGFYASTITAGSTGIVLPTTFTAGPLTWIGGGNDRLRTTNTELTRYDQNIGGVTGYTGRLYVNSGANKSRFLSLTLSEDDEIQIIVKTDAGGRLNFEYVENPQEQTDAVVLPIEVSEVNFVAKKAGTYHVYDDQGKPSYFRVFRKDAVYKQLTGAVNTTAAPGIQNGYSIVFTNQAGKSWSTMVDANAYSISLPQGYNYDLSLADANGYIITDGLSVNVTDSLASHDVTIAKVALYTVQGNILGLDEIPSSMSLVFTPDPESGKIFIPSTIIDIAMATYSVELEPGVSYTITALGVNDYFISDDTIEIDSVDTNADIVFEKKPVYAVNINTTGLSESQKAQLQLTFTNLYEAGYQYQFASINDISLRDGTYTIEQSGLDAYPLQLGLTSNLTISGATNTKELDFIPVSVWSFEDRTIVNGDATYKGMFLEGNIANEKPKGHLVAKEGAIIKVPVNPGEKVTVTYYYTASFSIEGGDTIITNSQSTGTLETVEYIYSGDTSGYVPIGVGGQASSSYFTEISVSASIPYASQLKVGVDKDFQTINGALAAVRAMRRNADERVTILVDPGNYEEMLVIDKDNITIKNASASPSIDLLNKGVDIAPEAVRVTSYYGHGYSYYSMGSDQKWNADLLRVNKENGYLSYENKGAGTTNGSYWNATVTVFAHGFEADDIIFENSFNQYISAKEAQDQVVMWETGSKGERPTVIGNTSVQNRSFVERAAALAIGNNVDKTILKKCRVIGRQDSFFGGINSRVVVYKGAVMGAVDYLFGGMVAVFYKTDLVMNTSDASGDASYLTAAQQSGGRGYLMYECNVTSTEPGVETASTLRAKPGFFGRPWQATTSEVVFYNTNIETSNYTGSEGLSLISPLGWQNTLGGESMFMYEFGTTEESGVDNSSQRASWATLLSAPTLKDGTAITTFNFTKGTDGWDPLPGLIASETTPVKNVDAISAVDVYSYSDKIFFNNVTSKTKVNIFNVNGSFVKSFTTTEDTNISMQPGIWIVYLQDEKGQKTVKTITF